MTLIKIFFKVNIKNDYTLLYSLYKLGIYCFAGVFCRFCIVLKTKTFMSQKLQQHNVKFVPYCPPIAVNVIKELGK